MARGSRARWGGWLVLAVALVARLCVVAWAASRIPPAADGTYYDILARRIADGHGYTWLWPDGVVTPVAHYPVGYPAALGFVYALSGGAVANAMLFNALLGSLGAFAVYHLVAPVSTPRRALWAGLIVGLHPGLVLYTPALMTEGVTAALIAIAACLFCRSRGSRTRRVLWWGLATVVVAGATLVRPQVVLLAPLLGYLSCRQDWGAGGFKAFARAGLLAGLTTVCVLLLCAPWTLRNCSQMGRCAFVSVNAGWNLAIGTDPSGRGGWAPISVPPQCRQVFDEAEKDVCFGDHARETIAADPLAWLKLAPAKLAMTFDYGGAGPWYLHEANPEAFGAKAKWWAGALETFVVRAMLIAAALDPMLTRPHRGSWRQRIRVVLSAAAVGLSFHPHAWLAYAAVAGVWALRRPPSFAGMAFVGTFGATALVHVVFFGAGRYGMIVWPLLAGLCALTGARPARSSTKPDELLTEP